MVRLFFVSRVDCVLKAVASVVPDDFDGHQIEVLGFRREKRVYFHDFGEFGAVFQESLVCFAPWLPSPEYAINSREFLEVIPVYMCSDIVKGWGVCLKFARSSWLLELRVYSLALWMFCGRL